MRCAKYAKLTYLKLKLDKFMQTSTLTLTLTASSAALAKAFRHDVWAGGARARLTLTAPVGLCGPARARLTLTAPVGLCGPARSPGGVRHAYRFVRQGRIKRVSILTFSRTFSSPRFNHESRVA